MVQEKVIEIIVYLLSEMTKNKQLGEVDMKNLSEMGYTKSEINTAVNWVYSKIEQDVYVFSDERKKSNSHRFLHQVEKEAIEPDAYGYLIELRELGLLTDIDVEKIIAKIFLSGYSRVALREMREITASHLLDTNGMRGENGKVFLGPDTLVN